MDLLGPCTNKCLSDCLCSCKDRASERYRPNARKKKIRTSPFVTITRLCGCVLPTMDPVSLSTIKDRRILAIPGIHFLMPIGCNPSSYRPQPYNFHSVRVIWQDPKRLVRLWKIPRRMKSEPPLMVKLMWRRYLKMEIFLLRSRGAHRGAQLTFLGLLWPCIIP